MTPSVFYRSPVRGAANDLTTEPRHFYCGLVRRIATAGLTKDLSEDLQESVAEVQEFLRPRRLADGGLAEPVPGVLLERFEVFDIDNDDLLLMWRIPMRVIEESPTRLGNQRESVPKTSAH